MNPTPKVILERASKWSLTRLPYIEGEPTLGDVIRAAEIFADHRAVTVHLEYKEEVQALADAWSEWLKNSNQFISEEMLDSMGRLLDLAGVELEVDE